MSLTLKTKAALVTTLLVLGSVSLAGGWLYRQQAYEHFSLLRQQQASLAEALAANLDDKLAGNLDALVRAARQLDPDRLADADRGHRFFAVNALRPPFDSLSLFGADGRLLLNDPPTPLPLNVADRPYFQQARDSGRPGISAPLQSRYDGRPSVLMVVPLFDNRAEFVGALGGRLGLQGDTTLGALGQVRIGRSGYFEIVTRGPGAVVVMHPDARQLLQPAPQRLAADPTDESADMVTWRPLTQVPWDLRIVIPAAEARAPLHKARRALLTSMLLLGVGTALLVSAGVGWLMRPLERLLAAMRRQRRAPDETVAIDTRASDERGLLAREFDALMQELRAQRAEMAAVSDASPLGLFRAGADGRLGYVNEAYLRIHGLAREDAAQGWLAMLPAAERGAAWTAWCQMVCRAETTNITRHLRRADGREIVLIVRSAPVIVDGQVQGHVGTVADVTERIEAERAQQLAQQALHRSEAVLRSVTEVVPVGIAVVDREGRYLLVNQGFEAWTGMPRDQVLGRPPQEVLSPEEYALRRPWIERALAGERLQFERDYPERTQHRHARVDYFPLHDENGAADGFVAVTSDISAARAEERRLRELAHTDRLTQVLNRAGFEQALSERASQPDGQLVAVLYIDLDHFKPVNDEHGHAVGDQVLGIFAQRLRSVVRPTDTIARLGGDEFAIVLDGLHQEANAARVADQVVAAARAPFQVQQHGLHIGASVGVAFWRPGQEDWASALERADTMLYRAKAAGRGQVAG